MIIINDLNDNDMLKIIDDFIKFDKIKNDICIKNKNKICDNCKLCV